MIAAGVVIYGAGLLAPEILGVDIGEANVLAVSIHLTLNALVFGSMAMAVGAVIGDRMVASTGTTGFMVLCYFLVGLLPLAESVADVAKVLPWYWFDGHDPLNNGLGVGYLIAQIAAVAVFAVVAWWGVEARDLTTARGKRGLVADLVERMGSDERVAKVLERLAGKANVSSVWAKTATQGRGLVLIVGFVMFTMMGLLMGPMYASLEDTLADVGADLPENLLAIAGGGDLSTPEGWYRLESFGLMAPIAMTLVAAAIGTRGLAGEEHDRTMGLLLANPIPRSRIVIEKAIAMVVHAAVVGVAIFSGVAGGSLLAGLDMSITNIGAAAFQVTLLGIMFGAFGLLLGAATGSVRNASIGTLAAFGASYAVSAVFSVSDSLDTWTSLSPFDWYLGGEPLVNGIEWISVGLFVGFSLALVAGAVVLFDRRDLRRG